MITVKYDDFDGLFPHYTGGDSRPIPTLLDNISVRRIFKIFLKPHRHTCAAPEWHPVGKVVCGITLELLALGQSVAEVGSGLLWMTALRLKAGHQGMIF